MIPSLADALSTPVPRGERLLVGGLAAAMTGAVRTRAAADLEQLGAADDTSRAPAGIDAHFRTALWELLGTHVRDQNRIWQASRAGFGGGWSGTARVDEESFIRHMRDGGWAELLQRLPRLVALLHTIVDSEIESSSRLLARVARDSELLTRRFAGGEQGPLVEVRPGLSDPHNRRSTVAALTFASGLRVIYKPRSVAMEAGLAQTLDWLREHGADELPAVPAVLERDGYGWCEFVTPRACESDADVDRYFESLGALATVLAALAATDCHAENFIARGSEPVLVDAETLLHPRMLASPGFSLRETEIVASQVRGPAGQLIDYPGLDLRNRRPQFDAGVEQARRLLRRVGDELTGSTGSTGPLSAFARQPARVVVRPTSVYGALLAHVASAPALTRADGGFDRVEEELHRYRDPFLGDEAWAAVHRAEVAALARGDVPYFTADTTTGELYDADGTALAGAAVEPVLPNLRDVVRQVADTPG